MKIIAEGKRIGVICCLIILVTFIGYFPGLGRPDVQAVLARGYYVPIVLAGIWSGLKGGLFTSIACSIIFLLQGLAWQGSISLGIPQGLEIAMYIFTGGLSGFLAQKIRSSKSGRTETASDRKQPGDALAGQTEKFLGIENELRAADRLAVLGVWGNSLAADMKGPLDTMRQMMERTRKDILSGGSPTDLFQTMVREVNHLNGIIDRSLLVSKSKKQRMTECDLNEIVQSIIDLLSGQARHKHIDLIMIKPARPIAVFADVTLMRQALLNVILQSMASLEGGGRIVIAPAVRGKGGEDARRFPAQVTISDTGKGMNPSELKHAFAPFHSSKDEAGLGMAIAKWAVEQMKGEIQLESMEGAGTTVTITIPCAEEKEKRSWGSFSAEKS